MGAPARVAVRQEVRVDAESVSVLTKSNSARSALERRCSIMHEARDARRLESRCQRLASGRARFVSVPN